MNNIVYTEYGLELLECLISEMYKIEGLKKAADLLRPAYRLLTNEIKNEKAALLAAESDLMKYNAARERLEASLSESKEQIKRMLDSKKILALLKEE